MKNLLLSFLIFLSFVFGITKCRADSYGEIVNQKKPVAILIYADWADNVESALTIFNDMQSIYKKEYSFATINICKEEAKEFNQRNYIYPNLPYVLLLKDKGRVTRPINRDCLSDEACIKDRLEFFAK